MKTLLGTTIGLLFFWSVAFADENVEPEPEPEPQVVEEQVEQPVEKPEVDEECE